MAGLGLHPATALDIADGHAMASRLVGPQITSPAALERVQARTRCAVFAMRSSDGELIGALAVIPLGVRALPSLAAGRFDGLNPPDEMLAGPGDPAAAFYGWGMAGLTVRTRGVVIAGALRLQREVYAHLPFYARAATSDGERILQNRLDAHALRGADRLVFASPWLTTAQREVA